MNTRRELITRALALYAVTDRMWLPRPFPPDDPFGAAALARRTEDAIRGGVTMVQLREKNVPAAQYGEIARPVQAVCRRYGVPFLIDDDVETALAVDSDGVHVGQSDCAAEYARQKLGPEKIIGVSVQTVEQAVLAERNGADYLGVGAMHATATKTDAAVVSIAALTAICRAVEIPVVAIGGITAANCSELADSGIAGVSVVSAIYAAADSERGAMAFAEPCILFQKRCGLNQSRRGES